MDKTTDTHTSDGKNLTEREVPATFAIKFPCVKIAPWPDFMKGRKEGLREQHFIIKSFLQLLNISENWAIIVHHTFGVPVVPLV